MKIIKTKAIIEKKITYNIDPELWSEYYDSEEEFAKQIIDDLGLISGDIDFGYNYFSVNGERVNGVEIEIHQNGEYDMYGGPYTPKMSKPTVKINGKDILESVKDAFENYGWDDDMIDVSRTDIWGYII